MNNPAFADNTLLRVKEALDVWSHWIRRDDANLGYPDHSAGFTYGNLNSFEDMTYELDNTVANAVDAIIDGLSLSQKLAVYHFHLSAVWRSNRTRIEDDYADALMIIELGLRKRGLV